MIKINIDGKNLTVDENRPILFCAREAGCEIPTLCHDDRLSPYTSCYLCVVEIEGSKDLIPSCSYLPAEGMSILTTSDKVRTARRTALELLLSDHYANCAPPCKLKKKGGKFTSRRSSFIEGDSVEKPLLCEAEVPEQEIGEDIDIFPRPSDNCRDCLCTGMAKCDLRKLAEKYQVEVKGHYGTFHNYQPQILNGPLNLDMNKCIRCAKCIRVCGEIQKIGVLDFVNRGFDTEIYFSSSRKEKKQQCLDCIGQGAECVKVCPTGALTLNKKK